MLKKINNGHKRILVFGKTGSGKSYWLMKTLMPKIIHKYDDIVIFTRGHNNSYYQLGFKEFNKKPFIFNDVSKYIDMLKNIRKLQNGNVKNKSKDGTLIYKSSILIIFDDVLDEKLFKTMEFMDLFTNFRHIACTTILLSQLVNGVINTGMRTNANFLVFFNLGPGQRRGAIDMISDACDSENIKKAKEEARQIYKENCQAKQYGYIIVSDDGYISFDIGENKKKFDESESDSESESESDSD